MIDNRDHVRVALHCEDWHRGITLAEIERRLRADGHSQDEIDLSLAFVVTVREEPRPVAANGRRGESSGRR